MQQRPTSICLLLAAALLMPCPSQALESAASAPANRAPRVRLSAPAAVKLGARAHLRATAADSPADERAGFVYRWSFGDGSAARNGRSLSALAHVYRRAGSFRISVSAIDRAGARSRRASRLITVEASGAPDAPTPKPTSLPALGDLNRFVPVELTGVLGNPGMGWQSGDTVKPSGADSQGNPIKVAYVKFYWKNLETADGVYDFSSFERYLNQARASAQKLAFRIVISDNVVNGPQWLRNLGVHGYSFYDYSDNGPNSALLWTPDLDDPVVQNRHFAFLREMGKRYNNDAAIDSIDIGSVGNWGEWHFWGVTPSVPMPSTASMRAVVDAYFDAFPSIPKVAQLQPKEILAYAVGKGAGFRGDCLGYVENQMKLMYNPNIAYAHAENAWKTAPINFETCWTISGWVQKGWDIGYIVDWALAHHINAINNKNGSVPDSAKAQIDRLLMSMGYRYVLTQALLQKSVHRGKSFLLSLDWNNKGVAPAYGNYVLGVRLRPAGGGVAPLTVVTTNSVRDWLPGTFTVEQNVTVPPAIAAGEYEVSIALINPGTLGSEIKLAIAGRDASGWYPVGAITVE